MARYGYLRLGYTGNEARAQPAQGYIGLGINEGNFC